MSSLVFKMLTIRLIVDQWRSLTVAVLTVSLGICLAMSIRFGTQSASLSLESNLNALAMPQWVGPVRFTTLQMPENLSSITTSREYRLVRIVSLRIKDSKNTLQSMQVSIEWTKPPQALPEIPLSSMSETSLKLVVSEQCRKIFAEDSVANLEDVTFAVKFTVTTYLYLKFILFIII